jgi:hypothetical protein
LFWGIVWKKFGMEEILNGDTKKIYRGGAENAEEELFHRDSQRRQEIHREILYRLGSSRIVLRKILATPTNLTNGLIRHNSPIILIAPSELNIGSPGLDVSKHGIKNKLFTHK